VILRSSYGGVQDLAYSTPKYDSVIFNHHNREDYNGAYAKQITYNDICTMGEIKLQQLGEGKGGYKRSKSGKMQGDSLYLKWLEENKKLY